MTAFCCKLLFLNIKQMMKGVGITLSRASEGDHIFCEIALSPLPTTISVSNQASLLAYSRYLSLTESLEANY